MHIVHTEASCGWGGQELRILSEAEGMIGRGHRITLVCPAEARIHDEARSRAIAVHALPIGRKRPGGVFAVRRWLQENPCDVVNTHSSTDSWLVALASATLRAPPPLVRTRHISAPIPDNAATRWLYTRATRHIVTTGEALRRTLIDQNHYPADAITSIPTGIDVTRFQPGDRFAARDALGLPRDALIIGILATLRSWKGHWYLLEAFAALGRDDVRLLIVGDGPQRDSLKALVASLGLGERVKFAGNQSDVVVWLRAMDVLTLPSYANEGVPQSLIQGMLCALPVVTTSVGSIAELVIDGGNGIIVPPRDSAALCTALRMLLADVGLRGRLGKEAHLHAARNFSRTEMLDRMEAVFRAATLARHARQL